MEYEFQTVLEFRKWLETELAKQYNELSKNINTAFWFFELLWR